MKERCSWVLSTIGFAYLAVVASVLAAAKILNNKCDAKVPFRSQKVFLLCTYSIVIFVIFVCSIFYILEWSCGWQSKELKWCCKAKLQLFRSNVTLHSIVEIVALIVFASFAITEIALTSEAVFDCLDSSSKSPSSVQVDIIGYALTRGLTVVFSCLLLTLFELLKPTSPSTCIQFVRSVGSIALIIGNGVLWLEAFMISLSEKSLVFSATETNETCLQQENVSKCLESRHNYSKTLRPILIPFFTEYSLAALLIGLHSLTTSSKNTETGDDSDSSSDNEAVSENEDFASENTENGFLSVISNQSDKVNLIDFGWIVAFIIFILLPLTLSSAALLFENEVTISTKGFTTDSERNLNNVAIISLALNAAGILMIMLAFACCYKTAWRQETKRTWKEIVLFLSLLSLYFSWPLQVDFDVSCKPNATLSGLNCHSRDDTLLNINIAFAVTSAVEGASQFFLLLYLKRIYLPRTKWLKFFLSVLVAINLALWAIDTFYWSEKNLFLQQASKGSTDKEWHFYTTALLSITIFFRYECAVTFFFALAETLKNQDTIRSFLQKGQYTSKFTLQKMKLGKQEDGFPFRFELKGTQSLSPIYIRPILEEINGMLKDKLKLKEDDRLWPSPKEILRRSHNEEKIPLMPVILEKLVLLGVTLPSVRKELHTVLVLSDLTTADVCDHLQDVILKDKRCFYVTAKIKDFDLDILLWKSIDDICRTQKKSEQFLTSLKLQIVLCEPFQFTDDNDAMIVMIDAITRIRFNKERILQTFPMKNRAVKITAAEETLTQKRCYLKKLRVNKEEEIVEVGEPVDPEQRERIKFEYAESTKAKAINICKMIALTREEFPEKDFPFCVITYNKKSVIVSGETEMCPDLLTSQSTSKFECFFAVWENEEPQQKEFTIKAEVHINEGQKEKESLKFSWPKKQVVLLTTMKSVAAALLKCKSAKSCYWKERSRSKSQKKIAQKCKEKSLIAYKNKIIFFYNDEPIGMSEDETLTQLIKKCKKQEDMKDQKANAYQLSLNEERQDNLTLKVEEVEKKYSEDIDVQLDTKEKDFVFVIDNQNQNHCHPCCLHCFLDITIREFRNKCVRHLRLEEERIESLKYNEKDITKCEYLAELPDLSANNCVTVKVTLNNPEGNGSGSDAQAQDDGTLLTAKHSRHERTCSLL